MIFEEFRADPNLELDRLCRFLEIGVEPSMVIESDINRGGEARSALVARLMSAARSQDVVREATIRLVPRVLRDRIRAKNLRQPSLDPTTLTRLNEKLEAARQSVEEVTERSIPAWIDIGSPGRSAQV